MKKKRWLEMSLILILGICLLAGCEQRGKKVEVGSEKVTNEEVVLSQANLEQETIETQKEQEGVQIAKQVSPKISKKERRIKEKVLKIVDKIEKICQEIDKPHMDEVGVQLLIDFDLNKLIKIGSISTPILIEVVKDKKRHWYLRVMLSKFISAEGGLNDQRINEPLMALLEDKSDHSIVRGEAALTLAKDGCVGAEYLLRILKDESDRYIRINILRGVGTYLRDEKGIEALVEALDDEDEVVAVVSVRGLGFIGGEKVVEPLIKALKGNRHALVRANAPDALANTKSRRAIDPLIEEAKKGNYWTADALGELGKEMIGEDRDRIVEVLIESLTYKEGLISRGGASALGEIGDKRAVEPLIEALWTTKGSSDSWMIINALGKIGDERAIEPLEKALQDERYKNARINIIGALADITGEDFKKLNAKFKRLGR